MRTTLHFSNGDRTQVDTSKPTYTFDSTTAPSKLAMQFTNLPNNNILYGKDANDKQIIFNDYLIVRIQVVYTGAAGTADDEIIVQDEGHFYLQVTDPCIMPDGGAVTPRTIPDIEYWVKDALYSEPVTLFLDAPTTAHWTTPAGQARGITENYLYTNSDHLCGPKSYEIVMADKTTPNSNTAYLNIVQPGANVQLTTYTTDPVHFTNANVRYYLKVTLDDYVYRFPNEAVYYEPFNLNVRNCIIESFDIGSWIAD